MPLQPPQFVGNLDSSNPIGTDNRNITDDSLRNFKEGMRMSFPNVTGAVTSTHGDLNLLSAVAAGGGKVMTGNGGVTKALFANSTAPLGWTIDATFDADMVVTAGTVGGTVVQGGDRSGTDDPGRNDKVATHTHPTVAHQHFAARLITVTSRGSPSSTTTMAVSYNSNQEDETYLAEATPGAADVHLTSSTAPDTQANIGAADWVPKVAATIVCTLDA